jgi:hypothetical protein
VRVVLGLLRSASVLDLYRQRSRSQQRSGTSPVVRFDKQFHHESTKRIWSHECGYRASNLKVRPSNTRKGSATTRDSHRGEVSGFQPREATYWGDVTLDLWSTLAGVTQDTDASTLLASETRP